MFCVIAWPRGKRPDVYGPFPSVLHAGDFAKEHKQLTGCATETRPIEQPPVYGDEGL